jgi:hypothetical protein
MGDVSAGEGMASRERIVTIHSRRNPLRTEVEDSVEALRN